MVSDILHVPSSSLILCVYSMLVLLNNSKLVLSLILTDVSLILTDSEI